MNINLHLIILILAFLCAALSAVGVATPRVNLLALAIALWLLTLIIPRGT